MRASRAGLAIAAIAFSLALAAAPPSLAQQKPADAIHIGAQDIGGVVTSPHGPEAGVWVIAETTELPTKFTRIVVTDDKGRYLVPDLPTADYYVWVRGYGLVDSPKMRGAPGRRLDLEAVPAPSAADAAHYYPAIYWYSMLKIPDAKRVRRHERHPQGHHPGRVAHHDEEPRLRRLPPARPAGDAHHPGGVQQDVVARRLDAPRPVGPGGALHGEPARRPSGRRAVQIPRRLDRPHRQGRAAAREAAAAAGCRAQRRHHRMGVGQRAYVSPRRDLDRQAQSHGECLWADLRLDRVQHRGSADPRPEDQHGELVQGAGARRRHAGIPRPRPCRGFEADDAVGLLGRPANLEPADQQPQRHVRR